MAKILFAEDDKTVAAMVDDWLSMQLHTVEVVSNGADAVERLLHYDYDLAILDWSLPGVDGDEICRRCRAGGKGLPILMLTGRSKLADKTQGLDSGADDYLTKPFEPEELSARVRALLRRTPQFQSNQIRILDLSLDLGARELKQGDRSIELVPREFALLEFLMRHPDEVHSIDTLLNRVWHSDSDASPDAVRMAMQRLRKKLCGEEPERYIKTVHRVGYMLRRA